MVEGLLFDFDLVVLVIKQVCGDLIEVIFLICVYCMILLWFGLICLVEMEQMVCDCWILVMFKDLLGGQIFGLMFDYIYCLLDFKLVVDGEVFEVLMILVMFVDVLYVVLFLNKEGLI